MMQVELTWPELRRAMYVGVDRMVRALYTNRVPQHGLHRDDVAAHIIGALGEGAFAKAIDTYWIGDRGAPDGGDADVGPFHVRAAAQWPAHLIIRPRDRDDEPFVLVGVGPLPRFRIAGWCYAREGKVPAYLQRFDTNSCWFVPLEALRPLSEWGNDGG